MRSGVRPAPLAVVASERTLGATASTGHGGGGGPRACVVARPRGGSAARLVVAGKAGLERAQRRPIRPPSGFAFGDGGAGSAERRGGRRSASGRSSSMARSATCVESVEGAGGGTAFSLTRRLGLRAGVAADLRFFVSASGAGSSMGAKLRSSSSSSTRNSALATGFAGRLSFRGLRRSGRPPGVEASASNTKLDSNFSRAPPLLMLTSSSSSDQAPVLVEHDRRR